MSSWFGPKAPSHVPTDTVAPLRFWDDAVLLKSLVVYSLARYDSLLDAEKLRSSLERLASIKGWKKLGARLRKNVCYIRSQHRQAPFSYRLWMLTASDRARVKSSITFPRPSQQSDLPLPSRT